jgi:hypothetical protein
MSTVDLDATIKGCRTGAWRLASGSLGLVAALSWQPLTLMLDTLLRWNNVSMGLSQVALIACAASSPSRVWCRRRLKTDPVSTPEF